VDFGSDSDGDDAFRWDSFEQTALIQRRVNELFGFEPKDKQVEAIRKLSLPKQALVKALSFLIVRRGAVRGAMVVPKVKNITINNNDHITEVFTGMFI
jgi:hypothetical protein